MKTGDKVFVPTSVNCIWTGNAEILNLQTNGRYADVRMLDGSMAGKIGGFEISKLESPKPPQIEGGAPHGFGVWVDGKYHPVDIGALGTIISDLQAWKESAIKSTPDWQAIGEELGLLVGIDVPQVLLQKIRALKTQLANEVSWGTSCVCRWQGGKVISTCGAHQQLINEERNRLAERYRKLTETI